MSKKLIELRQQRDALASGAPTSARPEPPGADAPSLPRYRPLLDYKPVPIGDLIADPNQPRKHFDPEAHAQLVASLKAHGQKQPCVGYQDPELGKVVLVIGERRLRAAREAGLEALEVRVYPARPDPDAIVLEQLVENLHRDDLSWTDQGQSFAEVMERTGLNQTALADKLQLNKAQVSEIVTFYKRSSERMRAAVREKKVPARVALALARMEDGADKAAAEDRALAGELTRAEAEALYAATKTTALGRPRDEADPQAAPPEGGGGAAEAARPPLEKYKTPSGVHVLRTETSLTFRRPKGLSAAALIEAMGDALRKLREELNAAA